MIFRPVNKNDISECSHIWEEIFHDSTDFVKWFFTERFAPDYGVCCIDEGKIISVIHGYPMPVKYLGKKRNGIMMSGVATLPEYRGRGLMHKLMDYFKSNALEKGIEVIVYKAADPKIYYSCDQYPCTERGFFTYINSYSPNVKLSSVFNCEKALKCYKKFSENYNGIILRDEKLMTLRAQDFFTDKCDFYALDDKAYCFATLKENIAEIHEVCYVDSEYVFTLFRGIKAEKISGYIPSDFPLKNLFSQFTTESHATLVPISPELIPTEPSSLSIGKRTEKLLLCPSTFIWEEY